MADIEWKPLPAGLWTPPAVFVELGNLLLQAFTDDGVPTWEISKKRGKRGEWNIIAKGTADTFEAAKAAALFEAEAASRLPLDPACRETASKGSMKIWSRLTR